MLIRRITTKNIADFKAIRLRALREDPQAFGSTYERELRFTDAEWAARLQRWDGERGIGYLAMEGETLCGIAGTLRDGADAEGVQLVSMWTAPEYRRQGVGRLLVQEIMEWARERGAGVVRLMVTSNNEAAMRFYERLGFARTGRTEPYPNDARLFEIEMARAVERTVKGE